MGSKYWLHGILAIAVIGAIFISGCVQQQSCREVQVPYEDTEYYIESEPYVDETCFPEYMDGELGKFYDFGGEEMEKIGALTVINEETRYEPIKYYVENFENRAGTFKVYVGFMEEAPGGYSLLPDSKSILIDTFKINANRRKIAYFYISSIWDKIPRGADAIYMDQDGEEYEDCKETTRYRDVEKSRTVIRYKTETQCE